MLPSALISFFVVAGDPAASTTCRRRFGAPHVARAVVGAALFLTVVGLLGVALGALVRNTAGGIATFAGVLFVLPGIAAILPNSWGDSINPYLPIECGRGDHGDPDPIHTRSRPGTASRCSAPTPRSPHRGGGAAGATRRLKRLGGRSHDRVGRDHARVMMIQRFGRARPMLVDTAIAVGVGAAWHPEPVAAHQRSGIVLTVALCAPLVLAAPLPAGGVRGNRVRWPWCSGRSTSGWARTWPCWSRSTPSRRSQSRRQTAAAVGVAEVGAVLAARALGRPRAAVLRRALGAW